MLLVFSGPLSRLFIDDAAISAYTTTILHFIAPFYACLLYTSGPKSDMELLRQMEAQMRNKK